MLSNNSSQSNEPYMMALGGYRFSINNGAYQTLSHTVEYRWQAQERLGRLPAQQYLGPGSESISLSGTIYPHFRGGLEQLDKMRSEAGKGAPLILTDGTGKVWKQWVINRIEETRSEFFKDGVPRKIEFQLQISRYGGE